MATTKKPKSPTSTTRTATTASKKPSIAKSKPVAAKTAGARKTAAKPATKPATKPAAAKTAAKRPSVGKGAKARAAAVPAAPKQRKTAKAGNVPMDIVERLRGEVRRALDELKAKDVTEIDVRGKTTIADYIVIASGTSTRHVKSISDEVAKYAKKMGMMPLGIEGQREAEWVLVDLGDIVVHVMLPRVREFYGLERLWTVGDEEQREAAFG